MKIAFWVVGLFFVAIAGMASMPPPTPEQLAQETAAGAIELCKEDFSKAKDRSDGTSGFIATACQKMEADYIKAYGRKP